MIRRLIQSFLLAFGNIRANFFHTFLSVLGIIIGVGALVSILSLIDGMEEYARAQITQTTSVNAIIVQPNLYRNANGVRLRKDTIPVLDYSRFTDLRATLSKPVTGILFASLSGEATVDSAKVGVFVRASITRVWKDTANSVGKIYTEDDARANRAVAVVNNAFVKASKLDQQKIIGKRIYFQGKELTVGGVVPEKNEDTPQLYFPITLLSEKDLNSHPPELFFEAAQTEDIPALKAEIKSWFDKHFSKDSFTIETNDFRIEQAAKGFLLFKVIMGLIVGISVIVGGVGVMNVLLISVTERTAEIGIRKAVGANNRDIVLLFLSESITVSAFGSFIGLIFGTLFTMAAIPIVKSITKIPFQASYTLDTFFVISIIAILVGVLFGTYPAIRASKLDPVEAIRHE